MLLDPHIEPWATDCWYDEVRDLSMVGTRELNDIMVTEAALTIEAQVKIPIRADRLIPKALTWLCHQRPRDLLREWIENLPQWDQVPRLSTWLITYAHAPNDAYSQDVGRLLIEGPVVRALNPGCQYRYVVILEGPEDAGKTKLVRTIATPDWYRELSHGLEGKEAHMRIKRAWVAELAELSSFSKTEEARLKSFFTLNEDAYIPKFSNFEVVHKRRTVFIGTVNPEGDNTYLRGQTGNTRYLPIPVHNINLEGFEAVRTQLFAEALQHYRTHPDDWWKLSSDGAAVVFEVREERRQRSVYEDDLDAWLERTSRTMTWWEEIATEHLSLPKDRWNRNIQMAVTQALKALGWWKDKRQRIYVGGESKLVVPWRPSDDWRTQP
jgi:predicted P-loop ATPase